MRTMLLLAAASVAALAPAAAQANGSLFFLIDGDTFSAPFSITNNSTAGETVIGFGIDLTGTGFVFDPVDGGAPGNGSAGTPFTPTGGSDVATGLIQPVLVADGAPTLALTFNLSGFGVGESFTWLLDIDPLDINASATVFGNQLIGAAVYADFSNGLRGSGFMIAVPGNDDAAQFVITTVTPTPAVPEPASWAMMIGGLAFAGGMMRHSKARVAFA